VIDRDGVTSSLSRATDLTVAPPSTYADLLHLSGFEPYDSYPWLICGMATQRQGWKLHVSTLPTEAVLLLRVLLRRLRQAQVPFKIASTAGVLFSLNEGGFGATQVGKFATIYPASTADAVALARQLCEDLKGFDGPKIPTDLRLGGVVYARYGSIQPLVTRDALGRSQILIDTPDGTQVEDHYTTPFELPFGIENPFVGFGTDEPRASPGGHVLGPGYVVIDQFRTQAKGDVALALDMRRPKEVVDRIVKQGRHGCFSDEHGRDMGARLRRQFLLHRALEGRGGIPRADLCFESDGDTYLVLERFEGETLEVYGQQALAGQNWETLSAAAKRKLLLTMGRVAERVAELHAAGFVHRDITPSNILVTQQGEVAIIDLELTYCVDEFIPPFGRGTEGFLSPNQQRTGIPDYADDVFSLGCVFLLLTTGLDPRYVPLAQGTPSGGPSPIELFAGVPPDLTTLICECIARASDERPSAASVARRLADCAKAIAPDDTSQPPAARAAGSLMPGRDELQEAIHAAARGLLHNMCVRDHDGLWLSAPISEGNQSGAFIPEACRSAHRGVAGPLYALAGAIRLKALLAWPELVDRIEATASWLEQQHPTSDLGMPGLHFGEAGVALAFTELIGIGLARPNTALRHHAAGALSVTPHLLDITHGAAGIGLTALACADAWSEPAWLDHARIAATRLMATQRPDGAWIVPAGVPGMSGETISGFAHGVAGIVTFLGEYGRRGADDGATKAAARGVDWLLRSAIPAPDSTVNWAYSDRNPTAWTWWCHGAPGVALGLLQLYQITGDTRLADVARKALRVHSPLVRHRNLSQCHGLAGLAEIYVEAGHILKDSEWFDRAARIIRLLLDLAQHHDQGGASWLVESPEAPVAGLMTGCSGILHVLTRAWAHQSGARLGYPLLPTAATHGR
jgi:hypothetical protein